MANQEPEDRRPEVKKLSLFARLGKGAAAILVSGGLLTAGITYGVDRAVPPPQPGIVCDLGHENEVIAETEGAPAAAAVEYGLIVPKHGSYLSSLPSKPPGGKCPGDPALVEATLQEMQAKKELPPGFQVPPAPNG
jgi:hypothetical protein